MHSSGLISVSFPIQLRNCTPFKVILWPNVVAACVCIFVCSEIYFALHDLTTEGQKGIGWDYTWGLDTRL